MAAQQQTVMLDVEDYQVSGDGVTPFVCPVSRQELAALKDHLLSGLTLAVRGHGDEAGGREVMILAQQLATEALGCMQADTTLARLRAQGLEGRSSRGRFWLAAMEDRAPTPSPLLAMLERAFPRKDFKHYAAKLLGGKKRSGEGPAPAPAASTALPAPAPSPEGPKLEVLPKWPRIHSRSLNRWVLARHIIATKRGGLLAQHAAQADRTVTFARHGFWFRPLTPAELEACGSPVLAPELSARIMALFEEGMQELDGRSVPMHLAEYLKDFLDQSVLRVAIHMARLGQKPHLLPKELWTGSSGNVWDRMLRVAVREHGGKVTGHDHAGGFRYVHREHLAANELTACDRFVVYSRRQAKWFAGQAAGRPLYDDVFPEILPLATQPAPLPRMHAADRQVRTVMFVGGIYRRDGGMIGGSMHDAARVDLEARLLARLRGWGFEVLLKPHPENPVPLPEAFFGPLGARCMGGTFEQVCRQADVALFLQPFSSTFPFALRAGMPMVLMDFGHAGYEPQARPLLERRCPVVQGKYDAQNRARVDWDGLREAILRAPQAAHDTALEELAFYDREG